MHDKRLLVCDDEPRFGRSSRTLPKISAIPFASRPSSGRAVAISIEQCSTHAPIVASDEVGIVVIGGRHVSLPLNQWSIKEPAW
jgi:hypothetical protein